MEPTLVIYCDPGMITILALEARMVHGNRYLHFWYKISSCGKEVKEGA
jgi:hypothetical protein